MKNHGRRFRCCLDQGQHGGVWNSFFCCKVGKYNHIDPWCELFCQACFPTFVGLWIQYVVPICPNRIQERVSNCPSINPTLLKHVPQQKKSNPPFTILLTILLKKNALVPPFFSGWINNTWGVHFVDFRLPLQQGR